MERSLPTPELPQRIRGLRRVEYDRLVDTGALADVRCELLEGQLVEKPIVKPPHAALTMRIAKVLHDPAARRSMAIRMNLPFAATDDSEPEPDIAVVTEVAAMSMQAHPDKAFLLVEVCHSSDYNDRVIKTRVFARAKVPEYWIVDVDDRSIEVYTNPRPRSYGNKHLVTEGVVSPIALPDARVDLVALFG